MKELEQLRQAIAALESQRAVLGDEVVDAGIQPLKEKLAQLTTAAASGQQRRLATILFLDIQGSTQFVADRDPEDAMDIMDNALHQLALPIREHGGRVTRFMGDGFLALFGVPKARENEPEMAIRAALACQSTAQDYAKGLKKVWGIPEFNVRIGIHTGMIFVGGVSEAEDTVMGSAVNLAARLESSAPPGGIQISAETYQHVRGVFSFTHGSPVAAKGFPDPVPVYLVQASTRRTFRTRRRGFEGVLSRMVGRQEELHSLQQAFERLDLGKGLEMFTLFGEAGLGKSRLVYEFEDWLATRPGAASTFRGRVWTEMEGSAYALIRNLFADYFEINDDDPPKRARKKLVDGLGEVLYPGKDQAPEKEIMKAHVIGQLLGYDFNDSPHLAGWLNEAQQIRDRALKYMVEFFERQTATGPAVMILDDLHWADDSSLDMIALLATRLRTRPLMIVSTTRPTLLERRAGWFDEFPGHTRLDLQPLDEEQSHELVHGLLQKIEDMPHELERLIIHNADGNPFYLEELVKMLAEQGVIVKTGSKWGVKITEMENLQVPETLSGVLQARLDRLAERERRVIQQASVVGRVFWDQLVNFLNQSGSEHQMVSSQVDHSLAELRNKELIFQREISAFARAREYLFKHALLREVTYESVLQRRRRVFHGLVAEWLVQESGERVGELSGLIGDHLVLAGKAVEACPHLQRAGELAAKGYANGEALGYFTKALEIVPDMDTEIRYQLLWARYEVLNRLGRRPAQAADLEQLESLAVQLDKKGTDGIGHSRQVQIMLARSRLQINIGKLAQARAFAENALELARSKGSKAQEAEAYQNLGSVLWQDGAIDQAWEACSRANDMAETLDQPQLSAITLRQLGNVRYMQARWEETRQLYERSLEKSLQAGNIKYQAITLGNLGMVAVNQGDIETGQEYYLQALEIYRQIGDRSGEMTMTAASSLAANAQGDFIQTRNFSLKALEIAREIGDVQEEASTERTLGLAAASLGDYPTARDHYRRAIFIADKHGITSTQILARAFLGAAYEALSDYTSAHAQCLEALQLADEMESPGFQGFASLFLGNALLGLGRSQEAKSAFKQALRIWQDTGQENLLPAPLAGLADAALREKELPAALDYVERVFVLNDNGRNMEASVEPARVNLICYRVLESGSDSRAGQILRSAQDLLQAQADRFPEPERTSFLENVPWNRALRLAA